MASTSEQRNSAEAYVEWSKDLKEIATKCGTERKKRLGRRVRDLYCERYANNEEKRIEEESDRARKAREYLAIRKRSSSAGKLFLLQKKDTQKLSLSEALDIWRSFVRQVHLMASVCIALHRQANLHLMMFGTTVEKEPEQPEEEEEAEYGEKSEEEEEKREEEKSMARMWMHRDRNKSVFFRLRDYKACKKDKEPSEFDTMPGHFAAGQKVRVPDRIITILMTPPDMRSADDIRQIERLLTTSIPIFSKYNTKLKLAMCRIIRYLKCGPRRLLLRQGHESLSIYYIYSGSVTVLIDTAEMDADGRPRQIIVPLRQGSCVGDAGVIRRVPRSANVMCAEECELFAIDQEDYIANGLHVLHQEDIDAKFKFFRFWPPVLRWSDSAIRDLSNMSIVEEYTHNKLIVQDGKTEMIHLVLEGRCDVIRVIDDYPRQAVTRNGGQPADHTKCTKANPVFQNPYGIYEILVDKAKASYRPPSTDKLPDLTNKEPERVKRPKTYYLKVGVLKVGDAFGLENALPEAKRYVVDREPVCVVSRGCRLIRISSSEFRTLTLILGVNEAAMRAAIPEYPPTDELCQWVEEHKKWTKYKRHLVEVNAVARPRIDRVSNFVTHMRNERMRPLVNFVQYGKLERNIWLGSLMVSESVNPYNVALVMDAVTSGKSKLK